MEEKNSWRTEELSYREVVEKYPDVSPLVILKTDVNRRGVAYGKQKSGSVSLAMPVFLIFMAVGTVFGVGGTSVISRVFGRRAEGKPTGHHLYSGSVYHAGVLWNQRAGLGAADSGSAVSPVGGGSVCVHNQENGIKNKS